jgi:phospholipid transport system substrate-binding protein
MRQDRGGEWKLRNVTIEAVNLGLVYQSQFSSAAKQYDGDIDRVIDNWSVDPTVNNGPVEQLSNATKTSGS